MLPYNAPERTQCDREVFLTKSSRHRICKGCRSEKRQNATMQIVKRYKLAILIVEDLGKMTISGRQLQHWEIHADVTSSDEDSNLDSNSQESKNRGDVDALYILAAESVSASHPFRASQTRSSSRIQHLRHYKEEDDDEDNTYDDNINELKEKETTSSNSCKIHRQKQMFHPQKK